MKERRRRRLRSSLAVSHGNGMRAAILVLLVGFAVLIGRLLIQDSETKRRNLDHALSHAESRMREIQGVIEQYVLMAGKLPGPLTNEAIQINGRELYESIKSDKAVDQSIVSERTLGESLTDPWGNYYHIQCKTIGPASEGRAPEYKVFIWSNGPNETDDRMGYDDLVHRFSIIVKDRSNKK